MYHFRNLSIKLEIIAINHFQKYLLTEKCNELSNWNSFHSWFDTATCQKTLPSTQEHTAVYPSAIPGKSKEETYNLQISVKLTKDVFLVPTLTTCGGFMTNFRFSPATMSGFFSRIILKTLLSNCKTKDSHPREHFPCLKVPHLWNPPETAFTLSIRLPLPKSISPPASEHI